MAQWFRMYAEVLDDPKAQRLDPALFKGWVNILCLAAKKDGALPAISDIAFALRTSEAEAADLLGKLTDAGLLDETETGAAPHNWNGRQFKSDVSTDRVKRFRKRHVSEKETVAETHQNRTEQRQNRAEQNPAVDSDFDRFWIACPRRVGKGQARKAYLSALKKPGVTANILLAGVLRYGLETKGKDPQYIRHPATWLNGEGWNDEPSQRSNAPPKITPLGVGG